MAHLQGVAGYLLARLHCVTHFHYQRTANQVLAPESSGWSHLGQFCSHFTGQGKSHGQIYCQGVGRQTPPPGRPGQAKGGAS